MGEQNTIRWTQECHACNGTGLYVGAAERDGAAVICSVCKGTGRLEREISYMPFTGRRKREGVERVFATSAGMFIDPTIGGGATLEEFEENPETASEPGREPRDHVCPAWWYQTVDYERKPDWKECWGVGSFRDCSRFSAKAECWRRWDAEHGNKETT